MYEMLKNVPNREKAVGQRHHWALSRSFSTLNAILTTLGKEEMPKDLFSSKANLF
jgi:hypothetical protein